MNKNDIKLLSDAKASNGGGVWSDKYPGSSVSCCLHDGWIVPKKGHVQVCGRTLLVITREGREALEPTNVRELVEQQARRPIPGPTVETGLPWED